MTFYEAVNKSGSEIISDWTSFWVNNYPETWTMVDSGTDWYTLEHVSGTYLTIGRLDYATYGWASISIRFRFSEGWDTETHEPTGTYYDAYNRLYTTQGSTPTYDYLNDQSERDTYWAYNTQWTYWQDEDSLITTNYIYNRPTSNVVACCSVMAIETIPSAVWEYDDTATPFFTYLYSPYRSGYRSEFDCRPFMGATPTTSTRTKTERYAFRSTGNNKVYFEFPFYHNTTTLNRPVAQTNKWFWVEKNIGLEPGDIISWIDPNLLQVRKFYVAEWRSLSYTSTDWHFAIPYENATTYV